MKTQFTFLTYGSVTFFFPVACEGCDADADAVYLAHHGSKGQKKALILEQNQKQVSSRLKKKNPTPSTFKARKKEGIEIRLTG
jgi:hypothetical protein